MRTIRGTIILPPDALEQPNGRLKVEVHDVAKLDAPSVVVAVERLATSLRPNGQVPFAIDVPEAKPGQRLSLRVHGSCEDRESIKQGDLLTTASHPVPATGTAEIAVTVKRI